MTISAAQSLPTQIRRIPQNTIKPTPIHDFRKFQKPMKKTLFQTDSKRFRYGLTLWRLLSLQETAIFGIGYQFVLVGICFFNIKLGNRGSTCLIDQYFEIEFQLDMGKLMRKHAPLPGTDSAVILPPLWLTS